MAKPWSEVEQSASFQQLSPEEQNAAKRQYFDTVVAPQVPQEEINRARTQFFQSTAMPTQETPPGTIPGSYAARAVAGAKKEDVMQHMDTPEAVMAGMGKLFHDIGMGAKQRAGEVYKLAKGETPSWAPTREEISKEQKLAAPLMESKAGIAGELLGSAAIARLMPGLSKLGAVGGGAATGAGMGLLTPTGEGQSTLQNMMVGGALGAGVPAALKGLGRLISPLASKVSREYLGNMTLGQALGGAFKTLEEKATSLPIAGHFIQQAQKRAVEGFNEGVLNKVLQPIGQTVSKIGHEGVREANQKLSNAYSEILPKLKIKVDNKFAGEMDNLRGMAGNLDEASQKQFEKILGPQGLGRKITTSGLMSGQSMKEMDKELGRLSRGYMKSEDFDKQQLGQALQEAQASLRSLVERSNPEYAKQLANINAGWARLVRVENAASRSGAKEGVFTPAQLLQAVRATDQSLRHKQFAQGSALFQDIAKEAEKVLGGKYPDPGTAGRVLLGMGAGAGYMAHPLAALGEAGLSAAYGVPAIQRSLVALATKRPKLARKLAEELAKREQAAGKYAGVMGTPFALGEAQRAEQ